MTRGRPMARFYGLGVSPGIAVGNAYLFERQRVRIRKRHVPEKEVPKEINRLLTAIEHSEEQIRHIRDRLPKGGRGEHALILEAHLLMLKDELLLDGARSLIQQNKIVAEWAVWKTIKRIKKMFGSVVSDYFRERTSDVDFVGDRILRNLIQGPEAMGESLIPPGAVVIAHDLSPADTAQLAQLPVAAIVTEVGGRTSHVAIVARSFEIPAVLGVNDLVNRIWLDDPVVVDGFVGEVIVNPSRSQISVARSSEEKAHQLESDMRERRHLPAETLDNVRIKLYGNIELPSEVRSVLDHGGEGIGLYRTEFLYISRPDLPSEDEHYQTYKEVITRMAPRPVVIRTMDIGGDKFSHSLPNLDERNPVLGLRAIRLCMRESEVFATQLRGLLRASVHGELHIMIPMVSGVEEVRFAKDMFFQVMNQLRQEGHQVADDIKVGTMMEVPSVAAIADLVAREVDFFSVGTNDLIQYTLAIDRSNEHVAYLYHPLHPAILRTLQFVVAAAAAQGVEVSLCGEMAADPINIPILLGLGFRKLSMSAGAIPYVKRMIRSCSVGASEELANEALTLSTTREIEELVHTRIQNSLPEIFRRPVVPQVSKLAPAKPQGGVGRAP